MLTVFFLVLVQLQLPDLNDVNPMRSTIQVFHTVEVHEGIVTRIEGDQIIINLGSDSSDLKSGDHFLIMDGEKYICKIAIIDLKKNESVCVVVPESWNTKGWKIEAGFTAREDNWNNSNK